MTDVEATREVYSNAIKAFNSVRGDQAKKDAGKIKEAARIAYLSACKKAPRP